MNQILATVQEQKKQKKSSNPIDVIKIVRIFAFSLLFFAVFLVGTASYALYKGEGNEVVIPAKPTITVENRDEDILQLIVVGEEVIDTVTYQWNDGNSTTLKGNNGRYLEQQIIIPGGRNTLIIVAKDINGQETEYRKTYELKSKINLEATEDGMIKITYEGDTEISYLTYRWDNENETKIEINDTKIDTEIEALRGNHTLTVIVVDIDNQTETKVQQTNGVSIPKIDISVDNENPTYYTVKVTDDVELQEVTVFLEDQDKTLRETLTGKKEFVFTIPLQSGSNKMEVTLINSDGMKANNKVRFTKP